MDWWARRPLPEGNCTLLASWSESTESLWQRLGAEGHWLRLPLKEGWLAVALGCLVLAGWAADLDALRAAGLPARG